MLTYQFFFVLIKEKTLKTTVKTFLLDGQISDHQKPWNVPCSISGHILNIVQWYSFQKLNMMLSDQNWLYIVPQYVLIMLHRSQLDLSIHARTKKHFEVTFRTCFSYTEIDTINLKYPL